MDGTGLCGRRHHKHEKKFKDWLHPLSIKDTIYNTYFPNAKHSRRTVEPLATWTTSGNCTSIFGSYSPITPTKRNTQMSLKSTIISNKSINCSICNCNFKSSQSFIFFLSLLLHDLFCTFWKTFGIAGSPDISFCVFVRCAIGLATKLSERNSKRCLSVMSNVGRLCQRCQMGKVEER